MKDYLSREQKNQLFTMMAVSQQILGQRTLTGVKSKPIWEDWKERKFLTTEESKNIKMANTYMTKFCDCVMSRLNPKEQETIKKQLMKFDFKIVDDFTLKKLIRSTADVMVNAAVPRDQFEDWCHEIMVIKCEGCKKHWDGCDLFKVFDDNFIPDGGFDKCNCKYAYDNSVVNSREALILLLQGKIVYSTDSESNKSLFYRLNKDTNLIEYSGDTGNVWGTSSITINDFLQMKFDILKVKGEE